jgi:hypothetical protein
MIKRLLPVFGVAAISSALVVGAQDRQGQPGQPGQQGKVEDKAGQPGATATVEGNWTVVSAARDGKAVNGADKMTVSIKGNIVTFTGGGGLGDKNQMRALRLDFGPEGTVRVTEAGADGKFGDVGGARKDPPGVGGTAVAPGGAGTQPGGAGASGDRHGPMSGVYVLTHDYLAISVFDAGPGAPGPGAPDRVPGKEPRPGAAGAQPGGTGAQPGGTATAQPGGVGGTPAQPGGITGGTPQLKTHVSVIMKRAGGPGTPGGPGRP